MYLPSRLAGNHGGAGETRAWHCNHSTRRDTRFLGPGAGRRFCRVGLGLTSKRDIGPTSSSPYRLAQSQKQLSSISLPTICRCQPSSVHSHPFTPSSPPDALRHASLLGVALLEASLCPAALRSEYLVVFLGQCSRVRSSHIAYTTYPHKHRPPYTTQPPRCLSSRCWVSTS